MTQHLKLALPHFLAVSARLKLGLWATYKQPLLLRCCLFACLFVFHIAKSHESGIVALCGFSMVTKPPGPGRSRLNWALLVREGKLVLTRTPCRDTVLIALQQQKGLLWHKPSPVSPTISLPLVSRTAPLQAKPVYVHKPAPPLRLSIQLFFCPLFGMTIDTYQQYNVHLLVWTCYRQTFSHFSLLRQPQSSFQTRVSTIFKTPHVHYSWCHLITSSDICLLCSAYI